ncbi:MAG: hypothetical protein JST43_04575 [Bacteroidetes bacterium]|nr:hypothetical protein [Bacteroidota bacterium]MBS1539902.1 hypothetical protein [Bacteroidota bacterium]
MDTLLIQVNSDVAYRLLQDLENLNVIKVLRKEKATGRKLSKKYAGMLPKAVAEELQNYVEKSREEWSRRDF